MPPPSGIELAGDIDTVVSMRQAQPDGTPDFIDPSFTVTNILAFDGGRAPMLDGLGQDRGITRGEGEDDETYRYRVLSLPNTVTPDAIRSILDALADAWGVTYQLIEVSDEDYQTSYDYPSQNAGTATYLNPYPSELVPHDNTFVYDDPEPVAALLRRFFA